jgi:hypothetical protein
MRDWSKTMSILQRVVDSKGIRVIVISTSDTEIFWCVTPPIVPQDKAG